MKVKVQNVSNKLLSTEVGSLNPSETKTVEMSPEKAYKAAQALKTMVDAGHVKVTVFEEAARLDEVELPGMVSFVDVTVTSAELLALNATPKTLVAAPGAGKILVFEGAVLTMDYKSAAYAVDLGDDLAVKYTNGSGTAVAQCEATGLLDQTSDQVRWIRPFAAASGDSSITPVANAPLVLHMLGSEATTGNSDVKLRVFFKTLPSAL